MDKPALIGASSLAALVTGFLLYKVISKQKTNQESEKHEDVQNGFKQEISKNVESDCNQEITKEFEDKDFDRENPSQKDQIVQLKRPKSRLILKQSPKLMVIVIVVTSKSSENEKTLEDLALRVTLATWLLCVKCSQNNQDCFRLWEQQGSRKEIYEIGSTSDLDQLHGLMIKQGYTEFLLRNSERLSVAMAIGPTDSRDIQNFITDLGFKLEEGLSR